MLRPLTLGLALLLPSLNAHAATWLWAWDRPEDLRWLSPGTGVAYFAAQLDARDDALVASGRRAALRVRPDTALLPVVHIEAFHPGHPPSLDKAAVARWAELLASTIARLDTSRVQIDFEARTGQRLFYRDVLLALRDKLPKPMTISVTALASWCGDPAWLATLPVDEVVPMYFRMGPAERSLWRRRMLEPALLPPVCRSAAGIATDEWRAVATEFGAGRALPLNQPQIYIFSPVPWRDHMLAGLPGWPDRQPIATDSH